MKGLAIVALLFAVMGAGLFALLRPSDADLRKIENEIAEILDRAHGRLVEIEGVLNRVRTIKPTISFLSNKLEELKQTAQQQLLLLAQLREDRPGAGDHRTPYIERRRQLRGAAEKLEADTGNLLDCSTLIDRFMHETQPRLKVLLAIFGKLYGLRNELERDGRPLDEELLTRIEYMRTEKNRLQGLSRSVFEIGSVDAEQGAKINESVLREIELKITDVRALIEQLSNS